LLFNQSLHLLTESNRRNVSPTLQTRRLIPKSVWRFLSDVLSKSRLGMLHFKVKENWIRHTSKDRIQIRANDHIRQKYVQYYRYTLYKVSGYRYVYFVNKTWVLDPEPEQGSFLQATDKISKKLISVSIFNFLKIPFSSVSVRGRQ
jgi:hypothetical protein